MDILQARRLNFQGLMAYASLPSGLLTHNLFKDISHDYSSIDFGLLVVDSKIYFNSFIVADERPKSLL